MSYYLNPKKWELREDGTILMCRKHRAPWKWCYSCRRDLKLKILEEYISRLAPEVLVHVKHL